MADVYAPPRREAPETSPDARLQAWKDRYANGARDRRRYEPIWQLCQSFIQNRQWIGWNYHERRLVVLPNPDDRERVTVNVLTQYLWTIVGKLTGDDFRPDVTFRREDVEGIAYARQAQRALEYGWDEEFEADEAILDAILKMAVFGTAGLRVRPDPNYGPVIGQFPVGPDGRPIMDMEEARRTVAEAQMSGEQLTFKTAREGRLLFEPLSPFNIVVPPGVEREQNFPWLIIDRPHLIEDLPYPNRDQVREEKMRAIDMIGVREALGPENGMAAQSGELRGHCLLKTGYKLPTVDNPLGETIVWAGDTLLHHEARLPFVIKGVGRIGWVPLHYHKVPGRFWSIGVVEPGIGPQKQRNRSRSQWIEMKDRAGLGRVFAHKNVITEVNKPKGGVFELVEVLPGHELPKETQGVPPGQWLADDVAMNDADLDKVAGLGGTSLSQPPTGVSAYAAFALLAEQDDKRVGPVLKLIRLQVAKLTKVTINGMRTYWPPTKQIAVSGESELLDSIVFNAAKLPEDCFVKVGKGAPLPKSPAALAQMTFDLFDRSISSGQVLSLDWLYDSLMSGRPQPLPKRELAVQQKNAQLENLLMQRGGMPRPHPADNDEIHVREHTQAEEQLALVPGAEQALMLIQQHKAMHLENARMKAMQAAPASNPGGTPANAPEGNGRDAGFGQQMMAAQQQPALPPAVQ